MRRPDAAASPPSGQDGFTLIEALVAMTVLVLLAAVLLRGAVGLRANAAWFDDRAARTIVAEAVLDEARANRQLRDGTYRGIRDGQAWTLTASPLDLKAQLPKAPDPKPSQATDQKPPGPPWRPQRLVVAVAGQDRPVTIETLRLAAPP